MDENDVNNAIDELVSSIINSANFTRFLNTLETFSNDDEIQRMLDESLEEIDWGDNNLINNVWDNTSWENSSINFNYNYGAGRIFFEEEEEEKEVDDIVFNSSKYDETLTVKECSICILDFEINEDVVELTCKHLFHHSCISEWSKRKLECPNCRLPI